MSKQYEEAKKLQQKILDGAEKLASKVAVTLGPRGQNVIIQKKNQMPFITKDGVTVAKSIDFEDPFENAAAQIIKQASMQTNYDAGDGTTTSTVLANAILEEAQHFLNKGIPPVEIKRGIEKAVKQVVSFIKENKVNIQDVADIEHIATISANGDKTIGKLIAQAIDKVGKDGSVTIEEARSLDTSLDLIEGFRIDSGYLSREFVTDERLGVCKFNDAYVLVTDHIIEHVEQILSILQFVSKTSKPFIIIADEVAGQALAACIWNAMKSKEMRATAGMKVSVIKAPRYGQERRNILSDLALSVGAEFITMTSGKELEKVTLQDLGVVKVCESFKNGTVFVGGKCNHELVEERIEALKEELKQTDSLKECETIQERITRLSSGVAVIHVGGHTEVEVTERKHRIEDALEAVKSAQEEGMLPGGGTALYRFSEDLMKIDPEQMEIENEYQYFGVEIIARAIKKPFRYILANAGISEVDELEKTLLKECFDIGYDVSKEGFIDMYAAGVIDPAKVTRCALQNAASVASTLITTKCAIVEN